jgi:Na+/H+ antiporter
MPTESLSPVALFEIILLLMALVLPLELLARRLHLPPAAALIVCGMALALVPGQHEVELDPDLTMVLFLPPLLLASAYFTVWRDFRANLRLILQLAVGAVAFTTLIVGLVAHWMLPGLPWAVCFALGAIVSPPDAVAAKAVLQEVRLPPKMTVLLEGESLVNDASGLVLFRLAVAAALTGTFSVGHALADFGVLSLGGIAMGVVVGYAAMFILHRLQAVHLAIIGSILTAWAAYIGADSLGLSGVLSTVAAGLVLGLRQHAGFSAAARVSASAVWRVLVFVLESLVFVLIGLSLRAVLSRLDGWAGITPLLVPVLAVVAAVVLSRFAWIIPTAYLPRLLFPSLRRAGKALPIAIPLVMSWAGMRGVVSLAAALALPASLPGRDFVLVATFAVILVTVLVQGATLAPLIRLLRLEKLGVAQVATLSLSAARAQLVKAQLAVVRERAGEGGALHPRLLEQYEFRARATERYSTAEADLSGAREEHYSIVLAATAAGRRELLDMHRAGTIHGSVLASLETELDLEELNALRHRSDVRL